MGCWKKTRKEVERSGYSYCTSVQAGRYTLDCYPLEITAPRKKNICTARSFGVEIKELNKLKEAVSSHANTCAIKLREEKSCCSTISVFLSTNPFKPQAKQ